MAEDPKDWDVATKLIRGGLAAFALHGDGRGPLPDPGLHLRQRRGRRPPVLRRGAGLRLFSASAIRP